MYIRALFPESATTHRLVKQAFWRVPLFTEWVDASSCEVILVKPSKHSTTWTFSSGTSGSRWFSLTLLHERIRRRIWWCNFSSDIDIVAETAIVSFHTLPVGFPLPTISKKIFVHAVLSLDFWPRRSTQNFHFWRQNSYFACLARYFSSPSFSIYDNQVLFSSDDSPSHTIPTRSWVSQTLVYSEQVGIILDRIVGSNDPEVFVDREGNGPASGPCRIDDENLNSSTESTISTSSILP